MILHIVKQLQRYLEGRDFGTKSALQALTSDFMILPHRLPERREHKFILAEFYDMNKNKSWFHRAEFVEGVDGVNTLEVYYRSTETDLEAVQQFAARYNLRVDLQET